jgi:GxxExxY protein
MWQDTWSERAIGAAIAVHRQLGPGLLEQVYQICLAEELHRDGIPFEAHKSVPIRYQGIVLEPGMRLDFLIGGELVLELKSVERLTELHAAQLMTYLKMGSYPVGLLINFNTRLLRNGIRRVVNGVPE